MKIWQNPIFKNPFFYAQIWQKYLFFERLWDSCDKYSIKNFWKKKNIVCRRRLLPIIAPWIKTVPQSKYPAPAGTFVPAEWSSVSRVLSGEDSGQLFIYCRKPQCFRKSLKSSSGSREIRFLAMQASFFSVRARILYTVTLGRWKNSATWVTEYFWNSRRK